ncbi:ABC transporter related protein [Desulfobulbus propionicus DSM 2032]|uniref:ABC transporter related protein n=1 Tax=Desulfobulbus propionicus (strain ATCC 33891 / DSM 2032 / VKM B-1956 / 1pr3) TaxID=577650 RepID=A0A7U4DMQ2_DESPD|nr:ATP-binding cassette domain-containing protein [Desulfobulbus propionicus]ADW16224.1 ABC transporter related protein [Desulfobulbus propionicus DSM 2032]
MLVIDRLTAEGLRIDHFRARPGEAWCLVGSNASGLEKLCDLLAGESRAYRAEALRLPPELGLLSFKGQQSIFEEELRKDDTDFLNRLDPGTPARAFLTDVDAHRELIKLFALDALLDRGYRQLSSGQARKLCLLQQITRGVSFLVLETPYEGLDQASCRELNRVLAGLRVQGMGLLLLVNNTADIPDWCTHVGGLHAGALVVQGPRAQVLDEVRELLRRQPPLFRVSVAELRDERQMDGNGCDNLVTLRRGFARYGEIEVFSGLELTINRGDHTLITGPNGCGKSTLLQIITGDHPLCYSNDLSLFGRRRGSGESIWEIKRQMGIVSADLHRNHRIAGSALAIVVSGLFDSIGLYTRPNSAQEQLGRRWLARLGLESKAGQPFRRLSYGEQRLLLLARALIKVPRLLILDEPTQGLDESNRLALLDFLAGIAEEELATMLYVSHRPDEFRDFFRQQISFQ